MRGDSNAQIRATGDSLARALAERMQQAGIREIAGRRGSNVDVVRVAYSGELRLTWISNHADVRVEGNDSALRELIDHSDAYFDTVAQRDRQLRTADRLGAQLLGRMRALGISSVASDRTGFERLTVMHDGTPGFTWRSNHATTQLHGNIPGSADFLRNHGHWERRISALERQAAARERGRQDLLARGRDALRRHGISG